MRQRDELFSDTDQPRCIVLWIAIKFEFEIACAGVFFSIGDTALAFNLVVETDGMADRNTIEPVATGEDEELSGVIVAQVR